MPNFILWTKSHKTCSVCCEKQEVSNHGGFHYPLHSIKAGKSIPETRVGYFSRVPDTRRMASISFGAMAEVDFLERIVLELILVVELDQAHKRCPGGPQVAHS